MKLGTPRPVSEAPVIVGQRASAEKYADALEAIRNMDVDTSIDIQVDKAAGEAVNGLTRYIRETVAPALPEYNIVATGQRQTGIVRVAKIRKPKAKA